ncbi:HsdS Restriction endonuclease S subunits [Spirosomataceae bacterium]|jgi:type I restriction enzyme S subunit
MDEIVEKPLKEIGCSLLSGFAFKSSDYASNGIPVIKIGNIQNRIVTVDINGDYVSEELIDDKTIKFLLNNSDILIAMTGQGSVGRVGKLKLRNNQKAFLNQRVGKFLCDEVGINKDYLYYILTTNKFQDYLFNTGAGSGQPNLSPELILQTEIPWVEYKEQTAIASILSSLDDKIDLLHRQNATLEKMAETLFRQWFVEEAKEEWETDTLGKQFDIGIGRTPPRKEHHWFSENLMDIKWVSIKDMGNSGVYISNVSEYLTREAVERFSIPIIPENTVMLSFKMTIGRLAITTEKMLSNEAIAHFSIKKNSKLFSEFLYLYLKTYQWEQLGSTSSIVESINSQMIKQMKIVIPEENLLMEFKEIIKPYFKKIKSNQTQICTLTGMRDTLLPKLMSGEVRVEI